MVFSIARCLLRRLATTHIEYDRPIVGKWLVNQDVQAQAEVYIYRYFTERALLELSKEAAVFSLFSKLVGKRFKDYGIPLSSHKSPPKAQAVAYVCTSMFALVLDMGIYFTDRQCTGRKKCAKCASNQMTHLTTL